MGENRREDDRNNPKIHNAYRRDLVNSPMGQRGMLGGDYVRPAWNSTFNNVDLVCGVMFVAGLAIILISSLI